MTATPTKVYPIPGRLPPPGVPQREIEFPTKGEAEEFLKANSAFAATEEEAEELAFSTPEATEADDSNVKSLTPEDTPTRDAEPVSTESAPGPEPEEGGEASNTQSERDSIPDEE